MSNGDLEAVSILPQWWRLSLYSYITDDFSLEGWTWEFMRRARLQEVLTESPVDAMNPEPDLENILADHINYYKPWNHPKWAAIPPIFIRPAVNLPGEFPRGFKGQQYKIGDEDNLKWAKVNIDLNRPDTTILRDFQKILSELRTIHPEPKRINPRKYDWVPNNILAAWDLRQFNVSWLSIAKTLGLGRPDEDKYALIQRARNAYTSANENIRDNKWQNTVL